jgi:hypothetical protein
MLQPVCPSLQHLLKEMESCAHYKYQLYFLFSSENYCNNFVVSEHPTTGTTVRVPIQHTMMFSPITTWSAQNRMTHRVVAFLPASSHRQPKAYAAYIISNTPRKSQLALGRNVLAAHVRFLLMRIVKCKQLKLRRTTIRGRRAYMKSICTLVHKMQLCKRTESVFTWIQAHIELYIRWGTKFSRCLHHEFQVMKWVMGVEIAM